MTGRTRYGFYQTRLYQLNDRRATHRYKAERFKAAARPLYDFLDTSLRHISDMLPTRFAFKQLRILPPYTPHSKLWTERCIPLRIAWSRREAPGKHSRKVDTGHRLFIIISPEY